MDLWRLWRRWVAANALSEMLGLGTTFAVAAYTLSGLDGEGGPGLILAGYAVQVFSGVIEATLVGLAQWWAMRPWFPGITRRTWWLATLAGALAAYVLGFLPSTIISLLETGAAAAPEQAMQEPPLGIVLLLAAGLGLVAGAVLSFAQWLALRRSVNGAARWIPANMLAWMVGMPVVFWGIDAAQKGQPLWQSLLIMAGALLVMGAVVGAIHGAFLARLAPAVPLRDAKSGI